MSEKLKGAQRAPITYYSVAGAKGKVVTRWIEPTDGYDEEGIITMCPGAIVKGYYQENIEERSVIKGVVTYGAKNYTPEDKSLCVERASMKTCYNNSNEVVEIMFRVKKYCNNKK